MIGDFTVAENSVLDSYYEPPLLVGHHHALAGGLCGERARSSRTSTCAPRRSSASPTICPAATSRSWSSAARLSRDIKLLIAAQPTRGVDVGSIEYIHERIVKARDEGDGVLIVSTELDEIMSLSDRILVMFRGRIVAEFEGSKATVKEIGLAMAGSRVVTDDRARSRRRSATKSCGGVVVTRFDFEDIVLVPILAVIIALGPRRARRCSRPASASATIGTVLRGAFRRLVRLGLCASPRR